MRVCRLLYSEDFIWLVKSTSTLIDERQRCYWQAIYDSFLDLLIRKPVANRWRAWLALIVFIKRYLFHPRGVIYLFVYDSQRRKRIWTLNFKKGDCGTFNLNLCLRVFYAWNLNDCLLNNKMLFVTRNWSLKKCVSEFKRGVFELTSRKMASVYFQSHGWLFSLILKKKNPDEASTVTTHLTRSQIENFDLRETCVSGSEKGFYRSTKSSISKGFVSVMLSDTLSLSAAENKHFYRTQLWQTQLPRRITLQLCQPRWSTEPILNF